MAVRTMQRQEAGAIRTLIQWRAVFGGAVVGLAVFALLAALWVGFAFGSNMSWVAGSLEWYMGGSAIFSLFLAGLLAGWEAGLLRGLGAGAIHGVTVWALFVLAAILFGIPAVAGIFGATGAFNVNMTGQNPQTLAQTIPSGAAWATFSSLAVGLGASLLGGVVGGGMRRPASLYVPDTVEERHERTA